MSRIPGVRKNSPAEHLYSIKRPFWIPVSGCSMSPVLRDGDLVRVLPVGSGRDLGLLPGMLVLLARPQSSELIVHRLVGIGRRYYYERGDRAGIVRPFEKKLLIGKVTHRRRKGKTCVLSLPFRWRLRLILSKPGIGGRAATPLSRC